MQLLFVQAEDEDESSDEESDDEDESSDEESGLSQSTCRKGSTQRSLFKKNFQSTADPTPSYNFLP